MPGRVHGHALGLVEPGGAAGDGADGPDIVALDEPRGRLSITKEEIR